MRLKVMLFGGYTPPPIPGRLVTTDDAPKRRSEKAVKSIALLSKLSKVRAAERINNNAERIRKHLIAHPWATANEVCKALGLTKTPVYNHLARFKQEKKVEVGHRKVGVHMLVSYKWRDE